MFCGNCGNQINDGVKFCGKCGTHISTIIVEKDKRVNNDYFMKKPEKNKLVFIANIVAIAIWLFVCLIFVNNLITPNIQPWQVDQEYGPEAHIAIIGFIVYLAIFFTIPTVLSFLGGRKNNRIMLLIASIVYFLSFLGIPSAIICIMAFIKMKGLKI